MFSEALEFNQDLNEWNIVSNVDNLNVEGAFFDCKKMDRKNVEKWKDALGLGEEEFVKLFEDSDDSDSDSLTYTILRLGFVLGFFEARELFRLVVI